MTQEVNFDGLVGPTHNYSGLSFGNVAAMSNQGGRANPRAAALQGLQKMRSLMELGLVQGVLPPQERPYLPGLRALGFTGTDAEMVSSAWAYDPALVANYSSASAMWAANAATVSPSSDTSDGRVHMTPANLVSMPHRSLEGPATQLMLETVFSDPRRFAVHAPLPGGSLFADEGAANHNRMTAAHGQAGAEVFVYGRDGADRRDARYPGRQTKQACDAIARAHGLSPARTAMVAQNRTAIDAGAFHNDVVCVSNETAMMLHEEAFEDWSAARDDIRRVCASAEFEPVFVVAKSADLPLADAVSSYVFNSQLISLPEGGMALILPAEADETPSARAFVDSCIAGDGPITQAHVFDLRESMRNGGGPACLRLRVVLTDEELAAVHQPCVLTADKITDLEAWVYRRYRDRLDPEDLGDPRLMEEAQAALDELTQILELGSFYSFQKLASDEAVRSVRA